jgi:hypothetical protein
MGYGIAHALSPGEQAYLRDAFVRERERGHTQVTLVIMGLVIACMGAAAESMRRSWTIPAVTLVGVAAAALLYLVWYRVWKLNATPGAEEILPTGILFSPVLLTGLIAPRETAGAGGYKFRIDGRVAAIPQQWVAQSPPPEQVSGVVSVPWYWFDVLRRLDGPRTFRVALQMELGGVKNGHQLLAVDNDLSIDLEHANGLREPMPLMFGTQAGPILGGLGAVVFIVLSAAGFIEVGLTMAGGLSLICAGLCLVWCLRTVGPRRRHIRQEQSFNRDVKAFYAPRGIDLKIRS